MLVCAYEFSFAPQQPPVFCLTRKRLMMAILYKYKCCLLAYRRPQHIQSACHKWISIHLPTFDNQDHANSEKIIMKKQMLILRGPGNSGKSTTIKMTLEMFLQWAKRREHILVVHYLDLTHIEVAAVVRIGEYFVGIASKGDTEAQVKKAFRFFCSFKCEIVLCATKSTGRTLKSAQIFSRSQLGITPVEVPKARDRGLKSQQIGNKKIAGELFKSLKKACR